MAEGIGERLKPSASPKAWAPAADDCACRAHIWAQAPRDPEGPGRSSGTSYRVRAQDCTERTSTCQFTRTAPVTVQEQPDRPSPGPPPGRGWGNQAQVRRPLGWPRRTPPRVNAHGLQLLTRPAPATTPRGTQTTSRAPEACAWRRPDRKQQQPAGGSARLFSETLEGGRPESQIPPQALQQVPVTSYRLPGAGAGCPPLGGTGLRASQCQQGVK